MPMISIDARYLRRPGLGISVYLRGLVEEVVGAGWAVTLLTNDPRHARKLRDDFPDAEVVGLPELRQVVWEQWTLPRYLARADAQIYLAPANRGLPASSPRRTRLALVVHDLIPLRMPRTHLLPDPLGASRFLFGTAVSLLRAESDHRRFPEHCRRRQAPATRGASGGLLSPRPGADPAFRTPRQGLATRLSPLLRRRRCAEEPRRSRRSACQLPRAGRGPTTSDHGLRIRASAGEARAEGRRSRDHLHGSGPGRCKVDGDRARLGGPLSLPLRRFRPSHTRGALRWDPGARRQRRISARSRGRRCVVR